MPRQFVRTQPYYQYPIHQPVIHQEHMMISQQPSVVYPPKIVHEEFRAPIQQPFSSPSRIVHQEVIHHSPRQQVILPDQSFV